MLNDFCQKCGYPLVGGECDNRCDKPHEKCIHPDFDILASINRIEDTGRYTADIQIVCAKCKKKMRFIGLPMGLDLNGAACSVDGTEGRFAIHPVGEKVPGLPDDVPAGFQIMQRGKDA